jgi:putative ABC transport system permease protein
MSLRSFRIGLRRLLQKDAVERDLSDEVAQYLEMSTREHMRRGLSREAAERAARVEFGSVEAVKETVRGAGWEAVVETVWQDVRYGWRGLRRNPLFTLTAAITLALGIGVNTAMFSVVNGVMLRPLPYHDAGRLLLLWTDDIKRGLHFENTAYSTILDWRRETTTFDDIAFFSTGRVTLVGREGRERALTALASANLWPLLGIAPITGRWLSDDDGRGQTPAAVISYALWQRRFAADPDIIGKPLVLDASQGKAGPASLTIVGVMPSGFYFPNRQTDIWVPATAYWRETRESVERFPSWARRWTGIGRVKAGVSVSDARADLARVGRHLAAVHPTSDAGFPGFAVNAVPILEYVTGARLQLALWLLMGAVALVLLVACANVGNLLLARGAARQHEIAVRRALGASRVRLVRQFLVESVLLALVGGAVGVLLAAGATRMLVVSAVDRLPRANEIAIDVNVLLFAAIVSCISGVLFGVIPSMRVTSTDASGWLKDAAALGGSPRMRRTRGLLVVAECSLAVVLLVGAGLLLRSLARVHAVDQGFDTTNVLLVRIEFPGDMASARAEMESEPLRARAREQVLQDLLARVADVPAVESLGLIDDMFVAGQGHASITFPGRDASSIPAGELHETLVTPGFFPTMRVPIIRGRNLVRDDAFTKIRALWTPIASGITLEEKARRAIPEPVVVNEAFVRRFLPAQDPIGERFCVDPTNKTYCYEIVGVAGNMHRSGPERAAIPQYFCPYFPVPSGRADLVVRTRGNPLAVAAAVREIVNRDVPGAFMPSITTADAALGQFTAQRGLQTWLLSLFAGLALALAAVGIYGIVHYSVSQRTREIGVRMALGARPRDIVTLVIIGGMRLPLVGVALGLAAAIGVTRVMSHLLFEVGTTDPMTFAAVAATLCAFALAACYAPARRAARLDAVTALRLE